MANYLICFHTPSNEGYAIAPLEETFFNVIESITDNQIHLAYKNFSNGKPSWFNKQTSNFLELDYDDINTSNALELIDYLRQNQIHYVLGFDIPIGSGLCKAFRKGGVKKIISYYGCPMSSINPGITLLIKKLLLNFSNDKPDHMIFESFGMQKTATHGRGITYDNTSVVHLGIDIEKYSTTKNKEYAHETLRLPAHSKIIFYAGHMEKRKGVDVIIKAATELINNRNNEEIYFLICGNRSGEEKMFDSLYKGTKAEKFITFGGYRNDLPEIMTGCTLGVIASTGWDSFPRTSLEMAASGLPLLISNLPGLNETIIDGSTGFLFSPGNHMDLADKIENISGNSRLREKLSKNAVRRVREEYTLKKQKEKLVEVIQHVIKLD